ncbi:hypothetical protein PG999_001385 [Apiospora kogelbergensis]|uniref:Uncharacterized protein n=1 Tax=Apiospora kogelbergensis TaxID=1337665 RepID=A0AAW0RE49_9PEZI
MSSNAPLSLGLVDPIDDETDRQLKAALQDLINGRAEAAAIARTIDALIVSDCEKEFKAHQEFADNNQPKGGEENAVSARAFTNPLGWVAYLWRTVGQAAIAIPHNHNGQDRLIGLLQELRRLPPRTVHYISGDVKEHTFWEKDKEGEQFCQSLRLLDHAKYANLSAFQARVFAHGLVDTTRFCALITDEFLGLHWPYNKRPEKSEPYVLAAGQWMTHAGAALWEMCEKKAYAVKGFNMKWWARWQARFEQVAADGSGFSGQAREAATEALKLMAVSKEGGSAGILVIEAFGLLVKDWEDED